MRWYDKKDAPHALLERDASLFMIWKSAGSMR